MHTYQVILEDPSPQTIWELIPKSYSFIERLNKEPTATFIFSFEELKKLAEANDTTVMNMFTPELREIRIERDETKIFDGVVSDFEAVPGTQGDKDVYVKAMGFFGLFKRRYVGIGTKLTYSITDAGTIAWNLINASQTSDSPYSDWGITQGTINTSVNRDRSYLFDNVYDSIVRLSNENLDNGFDFDIDNTRKFNVYYPTKGQSLPAIVFDERTMADWKYRVPLMLEMVNKVYVVGEGFNDDINYETRTAGTAFRTPFGTLEEKLNARNVTETDTLQKKGDRRLTDAKESPIEINDVSHYDSDIEFSDYNIGDSIIVNLPDFGVSNESKRVIERKFTMQSNESIGLIRLKLE